MAFQPTTEATSLTFAAVNANDTLSLSERALPYRPITIGGRQRAEFTWYPGSPSATVQMLGPEEAPITMRGFWKDRFITSSADGQYRKAQATYNSEGLLSVVELVTIVDQMRRSGRLYKFSWDRLQRFGHIVRFEATWHNTHDCEWELEFAVTAQEENAAAVPAINQAAPVQLATAVQADALSLLDQLAAAQRAIRGLNPTGPLLAAVAEIEDLTLALTNTVTEAANKVADVVFTPTQVARRLTGALGQSVASLSRTASTITDTAIEEFYAFTGGQDASPIGQQVSAYTYQTDIRNRLRDLQATSAFGRYDLQVQIQQQLTVSYLAQADIDFRDISTLFYGSQDNWIQLMRFNGYTDSRVEAGALIWVPPQPESGALGSGGDY